ncbi:MAG: hypothetical protein LM572_02185 [Ignisphaera sp.]|jgi:hypothetical protein|nr:hypothetical protein [Ignisphaera sp.]MCC6055817.1 hypothetical protein [Desulfurococcaceae archaeon]
MNIDVETLKNLLLQKGFEKVFTVEKTHDCVLLLGRLNGVEILVGIYTGLHSLYAKIAKASEILEPYWRCEYMEYFPQGLYTFSQMKNLDELAHNIIVKAEAILKRVLSSASQA